MLVHGILRRRCFDWGKKKSTCTDGYRKSIINTSLFYKFLFYFFIFGGDGILQVV